MAVPSAIRWSFGLGSWWGVPVRLHLFLVLFCVALVSMTLPAMPAEALLTLAVILISLLLHESAHALAAVKLGGEVDAIVLGPLGGLLAPRVPNEPEPQFFVAFAGPIVNLALAVSAAAILVFRGQPNTVELIMQVAPASLAEGDWLLSTARLLVWWNCWVFVLNLIPVFPFDFGPALRAMLWPLVGKRTAGEVAGQAGRLVALGLLLLAISFSRAEEPAAASHWGSHWLPLSLLAVFVFFSAQHDLTLLRRESNNPLLLSGPTRNSIWDDDEEGLVLVEHSSMTSQQEPADERRRWDEAGEDARVDDILARLHSGGLEQLSTEDRDILQRASRRYRRRRDGERL
jgi:Zn-dependent protease